MFCKYCGKPLLEEADVCLKCGRFVDKSSSNKNITKQKEEALTPTTSSSTGSNYILAILGFIFSLMPIASIVGFVLSIISLCQYKNKENKNGKGLAIAGLVISSVFLLLFVFIIIVNELIYYPVYESNLLIM